MRCPIIDEDVLVPCQLQGCRHHVEYEWTQNCLLSYLQEQGAENLSIDEIAFLYRRPSAKVKEHVNSALQKLRSSAITMELPDREFRYLITSRVCCVCESVVDPEGVSKSLMIPEIGGVYCSRECKDDRHPRVVELEVQHGLPVARILDWTFRRYKSLALAEKALGMPRWLVYESCEKYLDRPLEGYFDSLKAVQRQRKNSLIRRTWHEPQWVDAMVRARRPVVNRIARRHGTATWVDERIQRIRERLHYLVGK